MGGEGQRFVGGGRRWFMGRGFVGGVRSGLSGRGRGEGV